jgi:hypothetical protein
MGPINPEWIRENGDDWAGGRIDVYHPDWMFPKEVSVPIMKIGDWATFSEFLGDLKTETVLSFEELKDLYTQTNSDPVFYNWK